MTKKLKTTPHFKTAEKEAEFWEKQSAADYALIPVDVSEVLNELKAKHQPKKNVTFRLEPELMDRLKQMSKKVGVKYQTFVREWLWRAVA